MFPDGVAVPVGPSEDALPRRYVMTTKPPTTPADATRRQRVRPAGMTLVVVPKKNAESVLRRR